MANIIDVARALRDPIEGYQALVPPVVAAQLPDVRPTAVIGFIAGALVHQIAANVPDTEKFGCKVFKAKVLEIKHVERSKNGRPLGKKAIVVFDNQVEVKGKMVNEEISTHWVEFLGETDPEHVRDPKAAFDMALSIGLEADARALIGKSVFVRKAFAKTSSPVAGGGDVVKYLVNIWEDFAGGGSNNSDSRDSSRSSQDAPKGDDGDALSVTDVERICDFVKVEFHRDMEDLVDVKAGAWTGSDVAIAEACAKALRINKNADVDAYIDMFIAAKGSVQERAVIAYDKWLA